MSMSNKRLLLKKNKRIKNSLNEFCYLNSSINGMEIKSSTQWKPVSLEARPGVNKLVWL